MMASMNMMKSTHHEPTETSSTTDISLNSDVTNPEVLFGELHKKALAMGLKQHQLSRLVFVKQARKAKWKRYETLLVRTISVIALIIAAFTMGWILNWPVPREHLAELVWRFRGVKYEAAKTESCFIDVSKDVQDLARPPIDCSFCEGVKEVARVSQLSPADFEDFFAYSGQPVVVTDGAFNWSAVHVFNFSFFKGIYSPDSPVLQSECQFFPYRTEFHTLSQVFEMDEDRAQLRDGSQPWYIGWSNCDISAAEILREHYSRPYFLPDNSESSKTDWIFMGSPGYGAHMHVDNVGLPSWQAQVTGHKTWTLESPPECYHKCVTTMTVTVHPGEIIVLDTNKWFHSTLVVGNDISITIGSEFD